MMVIEPVTNEFLISEVIDLAEAIWPEVYIPLIGRPQVDYMLRKFQSRPAVREQIREGYLYFLLRSNDKPAGYFAVLPWKDGELLLSKIYLKPEARRRKFGKTIMDFSEKIARDRGLRRITLTVNKNNTNAIRAYRKMGFEILEPLIREIGEGFVMDDYRMEKDLR